MPFFNYYYYYYYCCYLVEIPDKMRKTQYCVRTLQSWYRATNVWEDSFTSKYGIIQFCNLELVFLPVTWELSIHTLKILVEKCIFYIYNRNTRVYFPYVKKKKIEISLLDFLFLQNILHKFSFSPLFLSLPGTVSASAVYKSSIVQSHFARDFF